MGNRSGQQPVIRRSSLRAPVQRICDAPGCDVAIPKGRLMCRDHWYATPRPLRQAISESWRAGRIREWSGHCLEARGFHAQHPAPVDEVIGELPGRIAPERAFELQQRLLGERIDA